MKKINKKIIKMLDKSFSEKILFKKSKFSNWSLFSEFVKLPINGKTKEIDNVSKKLNITVKKKIIVNYFFSEKFKISNVCNIVFFIKTDFLDKKLY